MPQISAVIPIFNGSAFLPAFFESLNPALPAGAEVILIDDGSTEPVWDVVPTFPSSCNVIRLRNEMNLGYSVAVNRGFAAATGEIVVQLNTDLVLDVACITAMVELIAHQEGVGVVGSKLVYPTTGLVQHVGMAFGDHTKIHIYKDLPAAHPLCQPTRELQIVTGATVATTRRVLEQLGPLDEGYFNHNEDLEHCLLAVKHGLRNFMCADSIAHHWESHSGPARFAQTKTSDAIFWSRWGASIATDLGRYVDEAVDSLLSQRPDVEDLTFDLIDLSRGIDRAILIQRLDARWPDLDARVRHYRQLNNPIAPLSLPLLLPHWVVAEPVPFIYLVDSYRELEDNTLWFRNRASVVEDELIADLTGVVVHVSELYSG